MFVHSIDEPIRVLLAFDRGLAGSLFIQGKRTQMTDVMDYTGVKREIVAMGRFGT